MLDFLQNEVAVEKIFRSFLLDGPVCKYNESVVRILLSRYNSSLLDSRLASFIVKRFDTT